MSGEQHLLKVYSDRSYLHTTTVRHQGTTVALAMDDRRRIVHTVLDLARHDEAKGELDAAYWSENPLPLRFPSEITDVGFAAVGTTALPVVKNGGRNDATGRVDSFNIEQSEDGLFNLQGTQAWTSPDPAHRAAVYEPGPGACPFTGLPLIPVVSTEGHAETALAFGEGDAHVRVPQGPELAGRDFTVEFWARRTAHGRQEFLLGHGDEAGSPRNSLHIGFREDNRSTFAFYAEDLDTDVRTEDTAWHPYACVYEHAALRQTVYRDGEPAGSRTTDPTAERAGRVLGGAIGGDTTPGKGWDTTSTPSGWRTAPIPTRPRCAGRASRTASRRAGA